VNAFLTFKHAANEHYLPNAAAALNERR